MADFPSKAVINEALDKIFAGPEFRSLANEILSRIVAWLAERLIGLYAGNYDIIPIAIFIMFVLLLIIGVVLLTRRALSHRRLYEPQSTPNEESQDGLWLACMAYAEKGIYDKAIVRLFIWYLHTLAGSNYIAIEKGKTNFQYELELRQNGYRNLDRFRAFKEIFAAVRYGGRDINRDDFNAWLKACSVE